MLAYRGSSFDLASRLYYFYHPSLALQSNESNGHTCNLISANFDNSQTGFVTMTAVPICTTSTSPRLRLNRRVNKRSVAVNTSVGECSNTISPIASQVPSVVNSGTPSASGDDDMRNVIHSEIRSALSSNDFVSFLSQSVSLHLAANNVNNTRSSSLLLMSTFR